MSDFQFINDNFLARSRKKKRLRGGVLNRPYAVQATPQFDAKIVEKGHL